MSTASRHHRSARGMVTAELAIGLLVATFVTGLACWAVGLVVLQTHCTDVAQQVARQLARGDATAAAQAQRRAPEGARTTITRTSRTVQVEVGLDARLGRLGPVRLDGRAVADLEPGVAR